MSCIHLSTAVCNLQLFFLSLTLRVLPRHHDPPPADAKSRAPPTSVSSVHCCKIPHTDSKQHTAVIYCTKEDQLLLREREDQTRVTAVPHMCELQMQGCLLFVATVYVHTKSPLPNSTYLCTAAWPAGLACLSRSSFSLDYVQLAIRSPYIDTGTAGLP